VSEALGLAWSDLDLDAGTATLRRGCTYEGGGVGSRLDDLKTTATHGIHHLSPTAVAMLRARRRAQAAERLAAGDDWPTITYEGRPIELVFTTPKGQLAKRQNVQQALNNACDRAGLDTAGIGTHTGRRSTITALFIDGASIDDIARHVGHASTDTTAGYVQDLGTRPAEVAKHAARLLDPAAR
jgi:integrase